MEEEGRRRPGALFVGIGVAILMLVVASNVFGWRLGPLTSFFEDAILLPVVMILVGRALNRRARRSPSDFPPQPMPRTSAPPRRQPEPPPKAPTPPVTTQLPPAPPVVSESKPPTVGAETRPAMTTPRPPAAVAQSGNPHEVHRARSSAEMIAEAKRKLADRRDQRPNAAN
jgi:hypothetical protein